MNNFKGDFSIDEIREAIEGMTPQEQYHYIEDIETELQEIIDELESNVDEISSLKTEIEDSYDSQLKTEVLEYLRNENLEQYFDDNQILSLTLGGAHFTVYYTKLVDDDRAKIYVDLKVSHSFAKYRDLVDSILPDFKRNISLYTKNAEQDKIAPELKSVVNRLINEKNRIDEI